MPAFPVPQLVFFAVVAVVAIMFLLLVGRMLKA